MGDNRKVFVLGMARSGYEAAKLLANKGYEVIVNDANTEQNVEQMKELQALGIKIVLGSHPFEKREKLKLLDNKEVITLYYCIFKSEYLNQR